MKQIPVDTTGLRFVVVTLDAKTDDKGRQTMNNEDVPQWKVQCLVLGGLRDEDRGELVDVTIASRAEPRIAPMAEVAFVGLVARPWSIDGRSGLSFSATGLNPVHAPNGAKTPPAEPVKAAS